jgi:hypothetical protein
MKLDVNVVASQGMSWNQRSQNLLGSFREIVCRDGALEDWIFSKSHGRHINDDCFGRDDKKYGILRI